MPEIDPVILAAMEVAKSKRREFHVERLKLPAAQLPDMKDTIWCPVCDYPIRDEQPCYTCEENKRKDKEKLNAWIEEIGGQRAWEDYTLARFKVNEYNKAGLDAARGFDPRRENLFFYGPRGTGKSHVAAIAKRPLIVGGSRVRTVSMPTILDEILAGIKNGSFASSTQGWLKTLIDAPILSVEDLAVEKPSEHVLGFYYKFINGRYEKKRNGMVITCNYSLDDLENKWAVNDAHGRVISRLKEMCRGKIISFMGNPDWREGGEGGAR